MTPKEAAKVIGCSPQQVRTLIRTGKIKATKREGLRGVVYNVSLREATRYKNKPQTRGWPRGQLYELEEI